METCPKFPGQQTIPHPWAGLLAEARRYGRSITIEECRAECKRLWQGLGPYTPAKSYFGLLMNGGMPASGWGPQATEIVLQAWRDYLAHTPAVGRQRTFLPLDPRKGGEIRLTAELAQLATCGEESAETHTQTQGESVEEVPVAIPATNPFWQAQSGPHAGGSITMETLKKAIDLLNQEGWDLETPLPKQPYSYTTSCDLELPSK